VPRTKTDFTNFIDAHPNYFPGQYLLEDDFEIQHQYLSDRQQYHQQSLHVSGIIEGLEVELIQGQKAVNIKSGSAIDSSGNTIVFKKDTAFSNFQNITAGELYLQYSQEKQIKQQEDVGDSYTRWQEKPILGFAAASPGNAVKLAKISIAGDTLTLDLSIRTYSGIFLPNAAGNDLTLRSGGNVNPNLAILNGSLTVTQNAYLATESGSVGIGTTNPGNYKLNVQGNQYLSGNLTVASTGNSTFAGSLTVTGAISGRIDTASINSGILDVARIPNLSADKINTGTLGVDRIPNLSADKINTGTLGVDRIPNLSADKINTGTLGVARIPNLSADKINTGTLGVDRIPNLSADKINTGTLGVDRIPNLSADKINTGTLGVDRIPNLSASKITSGTIAGNLTVTGAITPSVGNTETTGIMFPKDPGGGGNDAAWMRYYVRSGTTESCILEIGISNDTDDTLSLVGPKITSSVSITVSSSRELKENMIELSIEEALKTLANLRPVKYDYKSLKMSRKNLGFIAEEMPDNLASEDRKTISPMEIIPVLTRIIQNQQQAIESLQEKVSLIKN
jgi:Chaperone of endosialidase